MEHQLITAPEAAAILGVHRFTVNRWALQGDLEIAYRLPGKTGAFLFEEKNVVALAKEKADDDAL